MMEPREFWLNKAEEYKKSKKIDEALECMQKVRELEKIKSKEDFWYQKGQACIEIDAYDDALECLEKHLEINKADFNLMFQKGIALYYLHNNVEAIECFNKAWELKYAEYLKTKEQNQSLKNHNEFEKALKYETKLDRILSIPSNFWHYKGLSWIELENYNEAISCYDEALSIKPDEPLILFDKSKCELLRGNEENCLNLLNKACFLDSNLKNKIQFDNVLSKIEQHIK